jgi:V/A-type H+-transporting ATPase subunit E
MALADIVQRIGNDAATEAEEVVAAAKAQADALLTAARVDARQSSAATLDAARREADAEAETTRASARLAARNSGLAAKRELIDQTLGQARDAIAQLPDADYAAFLAARIARAARGGERVLIAPADVARLANRLPEAVAAVGGPRLYWATELAPVERGVVLRGDRVSVDLSIGAIVDEQRDTLAMTAADRLFGKASV